MKKVTNAFKNFNWRCSTQSSKENGETGAEVDEELRLRWT